MSVGKQEITTASKVAHRVARSWERIEVEDLNSHLLLWLYTHGERVQKGDPHTYAGRLWSELKREAIRFCAKETAQNIGQPINKNRVYTINRVRRILPFMFESPPQNNATIDPQTGQVVSVTSYSVAHELLIDVYEAYKRLSPGQREVIRLKFRDGLSWSEIAEVLSNTPGAIRMQVDRAIKTLVSELGAENEPNC